MNSNDEQAVQAQRMAWKRARVKDLLTTPEFAVGTSVFQDSRTQTEAAWERADAEWRAWAASSGMVWASFGKTESGDELPVLLWRGTPPSSAAVDAAYRKLLPIEYEEIGHVLWHLGQATWIEGEPLTGD